MTIANGYCTLVEFKAYKDITSTSTTDDSVIEDLVESASRFIDNVTGQFFSTDTGVTRYYTAKDSTVLFIDNLYSVTTLKTDDNQDGTYETTWNTGQTTGDFYLMPFNASAKTRPYSWIEVNPFGDYTFPTHKKGVQIIGNYGFSAIPDDIKTACLEIASAAYGRRYGQNLTGNAEVTAAGVVITPEDITAYARAILNAYKRGYG